LSFKNSENPSSLEFEDGFFKEAFKGLVLAIIMEKKDIKEF
jgi:hypothetical protein